MADMSESELLEALQAAMQAAGQGDEAPGAMTTAELADETGWSTARVRRGLKALKRAGRLERVYVQREALDDSMRPTPAYRIVEAEGEA